VATHTDGGPNPRMSISSYRLLYLPYTSFSQNAQFIQGIVSFIWGAVGGQIFEWGAVPPPFPLPLEPPLILSLQAARDRNFSDTKSYAWT